MAIRINTIEYGWESLNSPVSGSTTVAGDLKSVYIPETGSRKFLSAGLEIYLRDANTGTSMASLSVYQLSCSIDNNVVGKTISRALNSTGDHATLFFKAKINITCNEY